MPGEQARARGPNLAVVSYPQLSLKRQASRVTVSIETLSLPFRGKAVNKGHCRRPEAFSGHIESIPYGAVAALCCCTSRSLLTLKPFVDSTINGSLTVTMREEPFKIEHRTHQNSR